MVYFSLTPNSYIIYNIQIFNKYIGDFFAKIIDCKYVYDISFFLFKIIFIKKFISRFVVKHYICSIYFF